MADRLDYFFRQKVTEAELDLGLTLLEQADRDFANDIGVFGIIDGMIASERPILPDLTVELTAPGRAYDQLGQRIFFGTSQIVDVSTDLNGVSTAVQSAGNEKLVSLFVKFERALTDPRTDGNSQQVFFRRDESFQFVVRQGAEAAAGSAVPAPLQADEILIVDVTRTFGQSQILNGDLSPNPTVAGAVSRRQSFVFAESSAISVFGGSFSTLAPVTADVQATLQEVDDELTDHFGAAARRHTRADIDAALVSGSPNSLGPGTSESQASQLLGHINDHENSPVNAHAGTAISATSKAGSPNSLTSTDVDAQLGELLFRQNDHIADPTDAHAASAISYAGGPTWPDGTVNAPTNVELQLDKLVSDLIALAGSARIGSDALASGGESVSAGTIFSQLGEILASLGGKGGLADINTWTAEQSFSQRAFFNGSAATEFEGPILLKGGSSVIGENNRGTELQALTPDVTFSPVDIVSVATRSLLIEFGGRIGDIDPEAIRVYYNASLRALEITHNANWFESTNQWRKDEGADAYLLRIDSPTGLSFRRQTTGSSGHLWNDFDDFSTGWQYVQEFSAFGNIHFRAVGGADARLQTGRLQFATVVAGGFAEAGNPSAGVNPGRNTLHAKNIPKVWGHVRVGLGSNPPDLQDGYGISSVAYTAGNDLQVNFSNVFNNSSYTILAMDMDGNAFILSATSETASSVAIQAHNSSGTELDLSAIVSTDLVFVIFGEQS